MAVKDNPVEVEAEEVEVVEAVDTTPEVEVVETEETTAPEALTLAEAADYLNRSIGWFNEERKETLRSKGATLGGRGVGSSIPVSVLEELSAEGWKADTKRVRTPREHTPITGDGAAEVARAEKELADAEEAFTAAKELVAEKRKHLTATRREAAKAANAHNSAAARKAAELEKEAAKAAKFAEKLAKRAADAKAKAGIE